MQPETVAHGMQRAPQRQFWPGVFAPVAAHHAPGRISDVGPLGRLPHHSRLSARGEYLTFEFVRRFAIRPDLESASRAKRNGVDN